MNSSGKRKKKKWSLYTTLGDTDFSYLVLKLSESSFQSCGSIFQKNIFYFFVFFLAQLPRERACSRCHMVGTSPCCPLISLHSLLNFCVASCACLRFADQWKSWGTKAWGSRDFTCSHHKPPEPFLKSDPAFCSLPSLMQLRLHFRAELKALSGAVTFLLLFISKSSKAHVKNCLK